VVVTRTQLDGSTKRLLHLMKTVLIPKLHNNLKTSVLFLRKQEAAVTID